MKYGYSRWRHRLYSALDFPLVIAEWAWLRLRRRDA